jgi:hypothetical protein
MGLKSATSETFPGYRERGIKENTHDESRGTAQEGTYSSAIGKGEVFAQHLLVHPTDFVWREKTFDQVSFRCA